VGQHHIIRALCNQISGGQISHAYLFCGTRGTGKTSIARIFARAINCENPQGGNPCNICESCAGIFAERNLNVVEIDAASNNGVENIRDLREEVKYQPTQGKYKVYIIDEVHMLSTNAFNALLKTLEEPPAHVIFILATTDSKKLPATILSRCQRYDFRRIAVNDMLATLKKYLDEENVQYEEKALDYIAYHSDGAMRDALSLLDQSLSLGDSVLTYSQVLDMLGAVDRSRLFEFTDALTACDSGKIMAVIDQAMDGGRDAAQFVADLIRHFRDVLVTGLVNDPNAVDFSTEIADELRRQGKRIPAEQLMKYVHTFSETLREMRFAPHARTALEVCALKLCVPYVAGAENINPTNSRRPTLRLFKSHRSPSVRSTPENLSPSQNSLSQAESDTPPDPRPESPTSNLDAIVAGWDDLCSGFPNPMRSYCNHCGIENNDGKLEIIIASEAEKDLLKPKESIIREAIADKFSFSTPPNLAFVVREGYNKVKAEPSHGKDADVPRPMEVKPPPPRHPEPQPPVQLTEVPADWATAPEPEEEMMQTIPTDWATDSKPSHNPTPDTESPKPNPPQNSDEWASLGVEMIDDSDW